MDGSGGKEAYVSVFCFAIQRLLLPVTVALKATLQLFTLPGASSPADLLGHDIDARTFHLSTLSAHHIVSSKTDPSTAHLCSLPLGRGNDNSLLLSTCCTSGNYFSKPSTQLQDKHRR